MSDRIVCHCHSVNVRDIRRVIAEQGVKSLQELGIVTGAGTGCHSCFIQLLALLNAARAGDANSGRTDAA